MKIPFQDKMVEAEEVEVLSAKEEWNEYQLVDETIIKSKTIAVSIYKTQEKDKDGKNIYVVNSTNILRVK